MRYDWTDLKRFGSFDNASRWYPSDPFFKDYCKDYREPSRSHPWSYARACMTLKAYKAHQQYLANEV